MKVPPHHPVYRLKTAIQHHLLCLFDTKVGEEEDQVVVVVGSKIVMMLCCCCCC